MAKPSTTGKKVAAVSKTSLPVEKKKASSGGAAPAVPFALGDIEAMLNSALKKKAVLSKDLVDEMQASEKEEADKMKGSKKKVVIASSSSSKRDQASVVVSATKSSKKVSTAALAKGGKKTIKGTSKKVAVVVEEKKAVVEDVVLSTSSGSDDEEELNETNTAIIQRTILGLSAHEARAQRKANKDVDQAAAYKATMLEDPLAATLGLSDYSLHTMSTSGAQKRTREDGDNFVASIARQKGNAEYVAQDELLDSAHAYFTEINQDEKRRNRMAMARVKEMKRINESGGDKDGFKFVLPKSIKTFARTMKIKGSKAQQETNVDYSNVDPDDLQSQFLTKIDPGVSVGAEADRELLQNARKNKKKEVMLDDFYQHQRAKKWAKNAESFLLKGRANKNMFMKRQQSQRSTKKI